MYVVGRFLYYLKAASLTICRDSETARQQIGETVLDYRLNCKTSEA